MSNPLRYVMQFLLRHAARNRIVLLVLARVPKRIARMLRIEPVVSSIARRMQARPKFLRSQSEVNNGNRVQGAKAMSTALSFAMPQVPDAYRRRVTEAVAATRADDQTVSERLELRALIELETRRLDTTVATAEEWLSLRYGLMLHGFLGASGEARAHARRSAIKRAVSAKERPTQRVLEIALKASLDAGRLHLASELRDTVAANDPGSQVVGSYDSLISILCGLSRGTIRNPQSRCQDDTNYRFAELIDGHSVAVVGPAQSEESTGAEIDNFDVVARINYSGRSQLPTVRVAGARTDISYYNGAVGDQVLTERPNFTRDLHFTVFKAARGVLPGGRSRHAIPVVPLFFAGTPHMSSVVLFDLLQFCPRTVKVFNVNFFLARKLHHERYPISGARDTSRWLRDFAYHDLCDQVNLVRTFAESGKVEFDDQGERVLGLSNAEYLHQMEVVIDGRKGS